MKTSNTATAAVDCRNDAVCAIDRLLNERADTIDATLISATRCLVRYRNELIGRLREDPSDVEIERDLKQVNGALGLVFGAHYPLAGVHWERLKKVRDALAAIAGEPSGY